jgi:nucleoside 2-deoxyribosyltransferase
MSKASYDRALAFVAGTFARTVDPRPKSRPPAMAAQPTEPLIFFADNSRLQPDAHKQRDQVEAICSPLGLKAEWPSEHIFFPTDLTAEGRFAAGMIDDPRPGRVLHKAWYKIPECRALVAEITPPRGRGPHMNPVVAFEIGVAVVLEIPVFAWTLAVRSPLPGRPPNFKLLDDPDRLWTGDRVAADGNWRDEEGLLVENFEMVECAQIAGNFVSLSDSREAAIRDCADYLRRTSQALTTPPV